MRVSCRCGKILNVNDNLLGRRIKCPQCSGILRVGEEPAPALEDELEPAPQWEPAPRTALAEEESELEVEAPVKKTKAPPAMLAKNKFVVKQQVKLLSSKKSYE